MKGEHEERNIEGPWMAEIQQPSTCLKFEEETWMKFKDMEIG